MPTIAIVSQKGGAGKTTLAINLAVMAERHGYRSAIIDGDPQATAAQWGEWRETEGLEDPVITSPARKLRRTVSALLADQADFIVIDTPPHAEQMTSEAVEVADLALVACKPNAFDLEAIRTTARMLELRTTPAFVVFNGGPPNASRLIKEATEIANKLKLPVAPCVLSDRAAFRSSVATGRAAIETAYYQPAGQEVRALWAWLTTQVSMPTPSEKAA